FIRDLPGTAKRFWVLVLATGVVAGLGAVLLLRLLELTERLAWPAGANFLAEVNAASPLERILVPTCGGLLVMLVALVARRPLGGHGTAGIIESIWLRGGRLPLWRALLRGAVSTIGRASCREGVQR